MPLELHPVSDEDIPDAATLEQIAFRSGLSKKMQPKPQTPEERKAHMERLLKTKNEDPGNHLLKVIDTDLGGKMIAFAKWRINYKERTEEEVERSMWRPKPDEQCTQAKLDFVDFLNESRRKWMGTKPFVCEYPAHINC
jgi:hypothetical protein